MVGGRKRPLSIAYRLYQITMLVNKFLMLTQATLFHYDLRICLACKGFIVISSLLKSPPFKK